MNEAESGRNAAAKSTRLQRGAYGERKITQLRELKTIVWGLELDEGLRFEVDMSNYKNGAFLFLTKCDDRYCVSIKERELVGERYVPGGREQWKYFETAESAWAYINKYLKNPLEVYYY